MVFIHFSDFVFLILC